MRPGAKLVIRQPNKPERIYSLTWQPCGPVREAGCCSPVEEGSFAQQQLHYLGVARPCRQVEGGQASLVPLVQQAGVGDGLQQPLTGVETAKPDGTGPGEVVSEGIH